MDEMTKDEILSVEAAPEKTAEPTEIDKVTDLTAEQCDSSAVEKSEAADAGKRKRRTPIPQSPQRPKSLCLPSYRR